MSHRLRIIHFEPHSPPPETVFIEAFCHASTLTRKQLLSFISLVWSPLTLYGRINIFLCKDNMEKQARFPTKSSLVNEFKTRKNFCGIVPKTTKNISRFHTWNTFSQFNNPLHPHRYLKRIISRKLFITFWETLLRLKTIWFNRFFKKKKK